MNKKQLLFYPAFLVGLFLLLLNDFYLKQQFGNWLTGKLSDFAGVFIFPVFIVSLLPSSGRWISFITGLLFIVWKSPVAEPLITVINQLPYITIGRIVDYSDCIALIVLPFSHQLINRHQNNPFIKAPAFLYFARAVILVASTFAISATTYCRIRPWEKPAGTIYIGKTYTVKLPKDSVIQSIKELGYNCDFHPADTVKPNEERGRPMAYYQTDNITFADQYSYARDTILNIKYRLHENKPGKTKIEIINVTIRRNGNIQDWKQLRRFSRYYSKLLKNKLIEKIE